MRVLGIESSCDETGIAIYDSEKGLLANVLHSQIALHQHFGGVVPELASRDHVKYLPILLQKALKEASIQKKDLDAVAYTAGPGLIGALLTGACFAKALAFALDIKSIAVNHLEAHLLAAQLESKELDFPFLVLLVSGGHTQIIEARSLGNYRILGDSVDDAVGEAFDKTAKLMGIPYPGGAKLAALADADNGNNPLPAFPRPMTDRAGLDFSFSGLKTHALMSWNATAKDERAKAKVARAFQDAVVDTLIIKSRRAIQQTGCKQLVVAGGVGANQSLRAALQELLARQQGRVFFPRMEFCTDNGAMVAYAGCQHLLAGKEDSDWSIQVQARWPLGDKI